MLNPTCRFCGKDDGRIVLDLGHQPSSELFPEVGDAGPDPVYPLRMWLCARCGLAQLADDTVVPEEVLGREPAALTEQRRAAIAAVAAAGVLPPGGGTAMEFPSPHGGTWLDGLAGHGFAAVPLGRQADVVVDACFGVMHEADQQAALRTRIDAVAPDGTLVLMFHSLAAIMDGGQWNALRLGHYAYYSTPGMVGMLAELGMTVTSAHRFPLYGGTVVLTASRGGARTRPLWTSCSPPSGPPGSRTRTRSARWGRRWAARSPPCARGWRSTGPPVGGCTATRRRRARCRCSAWSGRTARCSPGVADASPAKLGRRMPGTDVPVIAPEQLVAAEPDVVLVFVSDVLDEVRRALPQIPADRWVDAGADPPIPRPARCAPARCVCMCSA